MPTPSFILPTSVPVVDAAVEALRVYDGNPAGFDVLPMSFTRGSSATRTDSAGNIVEAVPYNLLLQSETFDNASWSKLNLTISANFATSPNGTLTADKVVENTANDNHFINQSVTNRNSLFTYSVYAKKAERDFLFINAFATIPNNFTYVPTAYFNLSNGTLGTVSNCTASIQDAGNGWYRCVIQTTSIFSQASATVTFYNYTATANGVNSYLGNGTSGILLWGAQAVVGTQPLPYQETVTRLALPRLDYRNADGTLSSTPRLLLEPQRTNSIRNSTMVGAVAGSPGTLPTNWAGGGFASLTQTIVGLGTESGLQYIDFRFNGTASGTIVRLFSESTTQITAANGQTWSSSVYIKRISGTFDSCAIGHALRGTGGSGLGVQTATVSVTTSLARYATTQTINNASTLSVQPLVDFNVTIGATYDFTIRIAAPQMELGAYATSFIPTSNAAVTRLADACSLTGASSIIGQTEGTLYCEFNIGADTFDGDLISVNNGSSANGFFVSFRNSKVVQLIVRTSSSNALVFQRVGAYPIGTNKIAVAYKNGDFAISLNGTAAQVNTSTITMPTGISVVELSVPRLYTSPIPIAQAQAALYTTRLSDSELQALTTL